MLVGPEKELLVRTFLGFTVACAVLIQGCAASTTGSVSAAQPARAATESGKISCREVQEPTGPVLECPEFDLIVAPSLGQPVPLATLARVLAAGGLVTTESVLTLDGSQHPALRIEKPRSDGGVQIGWATIVAVAGAERNVTCYLRPPQTGERACAEGLSQLSRGQLSPAAN